MGIQTTRTRRRAAGLVSLGAAAALAACGEVGDAVGGIGVDVDIDRQTITGFAEPPFTSCELETSEVLTGGLADVAVDVSEEEELRGREFLSFLSIELEEVALRIVGEAAGGDVDTWDFVDSIRIFADDPDDEREPVLVAILDPVPRGRKTIVIRGTGVDIAPIASRDEFLLRIDATGRPPCDDVSFVGEARFDVRLG